MKLVLFVALLILGYASAQTCSCAVNGTTYDLSKLTYDNTADAPAGYSYTNTGGSTFYVNFCSSVSTTTLNDCNKNAPAGSCQKSGNPGTYYSAGTVASQTCVTFTPTSTYTEGVAIKYTGGATCTNAGVNRQTVINIACDDSAGTGSLVSESEAVTCNYVLYFASEYGCSGGSGGGGVDVGWIIILILTVFFFVYVIVGMVIKAVKFEARDPINIVPNVDFWKDAPFLFKDGCIFFVQKVSCGKLCGGYTEI
mmetsp:Transcript_32837/g.56139  ORF Transcript_32837/g.56139 Transcript_32837/m.56139 type:complete len:253 (-) Transcript_32837:53-811(-)